MHLRWGGDSTLKKHFNRAVCLALLLLYSFSQLSLIILSIDCHVQPAFYLWLVLICLSTWLTTVTGKGMWIGLPLSAVLLFAATRFFPTDLSNQLNDVIDRLTGAYLEHIVFPGEAYPYLNAAQDHSLLFLFLTFLLSSYLGAAITSRSGRIGLSLLGSVPFFTACLAVTTTPPLLPVFGMVLFWFLLAVGGGHYDENSSSYLNVFLCFFPITLLLSLLLSYINPSEYEYTPSRYDLSTEFDRFARNVDDWLNAHLNGERLSSTDTLLPSVNIEEDASLISAEQTLPWQSGFRGLDLSDRADNSTLEQVFLSVRTEQSGTLYLRAVSYGDYTGTGWAQAEDSYPVSSLAFTACSLSGQAYGKRTASVRVMQNSIYRYLPYFSDEVGLDAYIPSGTSTAYSVGFYSFPDNITAYRVPADLQETELLYRSYAHEYYTKLPEQTRVALSALCSELGLYSGMEDLIGQVSSYVQSSAAYDVETEPYPSTDYAVFFLKNADTGYCVHFATAAAALFRCLGVPARVVEGFLVEAAAGSYTDVKGKNAHAWVEVYQDGLGWLPVEVTGQSGLDADVLGADEHGTSAEAGLQSGSGYAEVSPDNETSTELIVGFLPDSLSQSESPAPRNGLLSGAYLILLLVILLIAFLPVRRAVILSFRNRSFEQKDTRKAVIAMYRTAQSALAFNAVLPPEIQTLAEKAAFSQHEIRAEEVENCRDKLYFQLKSAFLRLKPWDRFRFKYLSALL